MTPTEQRPQECEHYFYNIDGGWTHWCVNLNAPCRLFHGYYCPDFTPKTKEKDDSRTSNTSNN